jgi:hypothetical protein
MIGTFHMYDCLVHPYPSSLPLSGTTKCMINNQLYDWCVYADYAYICHMVVKQVFIIHE